MNELIRIDNDNKVSGRELHDFLEVGTDYRHWIDRMLEYGFTQGADFNMVKNDRVQTEGNRKVKRMVDDVAMIKGNTSSTYEEVQKGTQGAAGFNGSSGSNLGKLFR